MLRVCLETRFGGHLTRRENTPVDPPLHLSKPALKTTLLAGAALAWAGPATAGNFAFVKIDVPGAAYSFVNAISKSNIVVGGYRMPGSSSPTKAFAWANGTTTIVTVPGETRASSFVLVGVNTRGLAVGALSAAKMPPVSFTYDLNTAKAKAMTPPPNYALNVLAISDTDTAVGVAIPLAGGATPIFAKTFGKPVMLLGPAFQQDNGDTPLAVAPSGEIVGYSNVQTAVYDEGFSYLNGSYTALQTPDGARSGLFPDFVNNRGVVAGFYLAGAAGPHGTPFPHGLVLRGSSLQLVDYPVPDPMGPVETTVAGVTRTGDILGSYGGADDQNYNTKHGFILHHKIWSSFDVPGAVSTSVSTVNDQGSVAGTYTDAQNATYAFVGICTADQAPCTQ